MINDKMIKNKLRKQKVSKMISSAMMALVIIFLLANIVYSAEIEIFVNSYDADKKKAFIQIQNSGERDLHDIYYTIDSLPRQKLVELLPSKASNIILKVLSAGEHLVKVETKEGVSVEQKITLAKTEQQLIAEANVQKQLNSPLTAAQIENSYEAKQMIIASGVNLDAQNKKLEELRSKNLQGSEERKKLAEQKRQELLEAEKISRAKAAEEREIAAAKTSPETQLFRQNEQKKAFPVNKENDNLIPVAGIIGLIVFGIIIIYYFYKQKNE